MTYNLTIFYCQEPHRPCQPEWHPLNPGDEDCTDRAAKLAQDPSIPCLPEPPPLPPVLPHPCTEKYIWEETGSFSASLQSSHGETIESEGLGAYFAVVSAYGWAGCAAPKACVSCEFDDYVVADPEYKEDRPHMRRTLL